MLLTQVTGPAADAVTVAEAKAAARVDFADDDALIASLVSAASRAVGEMAGRVLTSETWALSFGTGLIGDLVLPKSPVQSITSITYYDAEDVQQNADAADFYLVKDDDRAFLRPKSGVSWPAANSLRPDAITVTFVAGYTSCPESLKRAVLLMFAHLYDNRSAVSKDGLMEVPLGVRQLVGLDRLGWVSA